MALAFTSGRPTTSVRASSNVGGSIEHDEAQPYADRDKHRELARTVLHVLGGGLFDRVLELGKEQDQCHQHGRRYDEREVATR
jgi:hypothetical protein